MLTESEENRMIKIVTDILKDAFASVYCDTCDYDMADDACEMCHRKYMNWKIGEDYALEVAGKILDELGEQ